MAFKGVDNKHKDEFVGVLKEMSVRKTELQSKGGSDRYVLDMEFVDDAKQPLSMFFAFVAFAENGIDIDHDTYSDAGLMLESLRMQGFDVDIPSENIGDRTNMIVTCSLKGQIDVPMIMRPHTRKVGDREFLRWVCAGVGNPGAVTSGSTDEMKLSSVPAELILEAQKVLPLLPATFDESAFVTTVNNISAIMLNGKGPAINEKRLEILATMVGTAIIANADGTYTKTAGR